MMVLAVAICFLVRAGLQTGFRRHELPALAAVGMLLPVFPAVMAPIGLIATFIVAAMVVHRAGWIVMRAAAGRTIAPAAP